MSIITYVLLLVFYGLIKIGEGLAWFVLLIPRTLFGKKSKPVSTRKKGTFYLVDRKKLYRKKLSKFAHFIATTLLAIILLPITILKEIISALQRKKHKRNTKKKIKKIAYKPSFFYKFKYLFIGSFLSFLLLFLPGISLIFLSDLPNPNRLSQDFIPKTTKIFDRNNNLLFEIYVNQNRTLVTLDRIPAYLQQATIAIEDKNFYSHPGFDLRGITRALVSNIKKKELQGGSTITQQLIKSALLTSEPKISRKIKEVVVAFWTERRYSKDKILELYFNYVPYGGTAWGAEAASKVYFGKSVSDLTLGESAYLAGLPRAPSIYSPFGQTPELGKKRQKEVLDAMVRSKFITQNAADEAYREELIFEEPTSPIKAPHFVMYVRDLLINEYGLSEVERGGLQVRTSLDMSLQEYAEDVVATSVDESADLLISNGAALITKPLTGEVLAMVGSRDYFDRDNGGNVNLTTSLRQPGSTIKLITYTDILASGKTEAMMIDDSPLSIRTPSGEVYSPVNYGGGYHGKVALREAFANSYNIPAVRIAQELGVKNLVNFGRKMGISSWDPDRPYGLSITLGGGETRMTELAVAYGTIANGGRKMELNPILDVEDAYGKKLFHKSPTPEPVVDERVAFIISDILSDNKARSQAFGPNSPLAIPGSRVSVKTGTTDNKRDNWTVGFTSDFVIATWVGNNDNSPMSQNLVSGITGAAPIWNTLTKRVLEIFPSPDIATPPAGMIKKWCNGRDRYFVVGTENSVQCGFQPPTVSPIKPL